MKTLPPYPDREVVIPQGHVWVEGDNHFRTDDSNVFGPVRRAFLPLVGWLVRALRSLSLPQVSEGLIESKLLMLLWPPERFGVIPEPSDYLESEKPLNRYMRDALWRQEMRYARVTKAPVEEGP